MIISQTLCFSLIWLLLVNFWIYKLMEIKRKNPSRAAGISPQVSCFSKKSCRRPEDVWGDVSACVEQMSLTQIFKNPTGPGNCDQ